MFIVKVKVKKKEKMAEYQRIIHELFGEDDFSEDEQTLREQRSAEEEIEGRIWE